VKNISCNQHTIMPTIKVQALITVPQAWLFELSQDYARRVCWDPFSAQYDFDTPDWAPGVGAELSGKARNGYAMRARYIAFDPPARAAFEMISGPWFFRTFAGAWRFVPQSPHGTTVSFNDPFTVRPSIFRWFMEPLIKRSLAWHMSARIAGLKAYAESTYPTPA